MQAAPSREQLSVFFTRLARRVIEVREVASVEGAPADRVLRAVLPDGARVFVKAGDPEQMRRFKAEARGLEALAATDTIRVPEVLLVGGEGRHTYLVLEHFDLVPGTQASFARMGQQLAQLHRKTASRFGFERDNYIGLTPQANATDAAWPAFFRERRLEPQLKQISTSAAAGMWVEGGLRVAEAIPLYFPGYAPQPSLLHGDLWSGNAGFLADGTPVIFDPAVYYGDREADIAMSELFGGFAPQFRDAYREAWPLDPGYGVRRDLYNLYHVLNHVNLFGASYVAQAQGLIRKLLSEIR
jgi:protein-ribulosamine 3-kinase